MGLYGFKKRFVPKIKAGTKRHTIRAERANDRDEKETLAVCDGFESFADMMEFWDGRFPFTGKIYHWKPLEGNDGGRSEEVIYDARVT